MPRRPLAGTYPGGVVLAPEGRRLLRLEARNSQTPIERKPPWIKTRLRTGPEYTELKGLVRRQGLHTVCEEAGCPNIFECWEDREATFLIGGEVCTRRCDFCQIASGKPGTLDTDDQFSYVFTAPGTYDYFCALHKQSDLANHKGEL